jgi:hypothetical protein
MNRRWLLALIGVMVLSSGCRGCVNAILEPKQAFDPARAPAAPDYSDEAHWAALPDRDDNADVAPEGESDGQAEAPADVFYIHPTTYYSNDHWNQPLNDDRANDITDDSVMRGQASAYNEAGRVYAPRYRQATLAAFTTERLEEARGALDLAYGDVRAAFDYFLENYDEERPLIIASHSQGSVHAARLLADYFADEKPLSDRLVAAFAIGMAIPDDHFDRTMPGIEACGAPDQTGCLVTYRTKISGADPDQNLERSFIPYPDGYEPLNDKTMVCVNPVIWTNDDAHSEKSDHVGAVKFEKDDDSPEIDSAYVEEAWCEGGALMVKLPDRKYRTLGKDLHLADYQLFYMDIRKNAVARTTAFIEQQRE